MCTAAWLIDQLALQGVVHFCIAPGSRSALLAIAAEEHPKTKTHIHFDERGLGFFALGLSMATRQPVALIVTSGTAVANLLPAALEASASGHPLLLLTADRPSELHDCGANQTMEQMRLFSSVVRWQADLPPESNEQTIRSFAAQGVFQATAFHPGPVQYNCRLKEPFDFSKTRCAPGSPLFSPPPLLASPPLHRPEKRGLIAVGPLHEDPAPLAALAKRLGWPLFADVLANLHAPEKIVHFDQLLKEEKPDLVLHFGQRLTSKRFPEWIRGIPTLHIGASLNLVDPARNLSGRILSSLAPFCESFTAGSDPAWLPLWQEKDRLYEENLALQLKIEPPRALQHMRRLSRLWKKGTLFLGSSLPIREANLYARFSKEVRCYSNRGVSGIDGTIATAAGIAAGTNGPVLAWIGDQSVLYDLNSLSLLTRYPLTLIIANNGGGGIFSHLPVASSSHFDKLFKAAHSWTFAKAAEMFSLPYVKAHDALPDPLPQGIIELLLSERKTASVL